MCLNVLSIVCYQTKTIPNFNTSKMLRTFSDAAKFDGVYYEVI